MFVQVTTDGHSSRIPKQSHGADANFTGEAQCKISGTSGKSGHVAITIIQHDRSAETNVVTRQGYVSLNGEEIEKLVEVAVSNGIIQSPLAAELASLRAQLQAAVELIDKATPKTKLVLSIRERREATAKHSTTAKKSPKRALPLRAKTSKRDSVQKEGP